MRALRDLPWDEGWAAGSKTAHKLIEYLDELKPRKILDIGSGLTTVLFAEWAKENGAEVISLEHQEKYYNATSKLLDEHSLRADLRLCKLVKTKWGMFYETNIPQGLDFILIDGPPGSIGRGATLYNIYPSLSKDFTAWLDDCTRPQEKQILKQWVQDLEVEVIDIEGLSRGKIIK